MREYTILNILHTSSLPVKMSALMDQLGVGERTIRGMIRSLDDAGKKHGFTIKTVRNQGFLLQIEDQEQFLAYLDHGRRLRNTVIVDSPSSRQQYIAYCLLQSSSYKSMEQIAEQMGISRTTLISDLKQVEQNIAAFELRLQRRPHYGVRITGDEKNIRKAFSHFVLQSHQVLEQNGDFHQFSCKFKAYEKELKSYLLQILKEKSLSISDVFLNNIVTHLFILLYRISKSNYIVEGQPVLKASEQLYHDIAEKIASWVEQHEGISIPRDEIDYLALHISGKTVAENIGETDKHELREGIRTILHRLDQEFLTEFTMDTELQQSLLMHMLPLLKRLYYNLQLGNPLVEDVYSEYANVFVISFRFAEIIEEQYGFKMSRDEVGYVALHFATHLERKKQQNLEQFKRIAVICSTGAGSAHLIRLKLEAVFPRASVVTASIAELENMLSRPVDLILTTVPLSINVQEKPVIHIKSLLDDQEIQRIREILSLSIDSSRPSYKLTDFKDLFNEDLFHLAGQDQYMDLLEERCQEIVAKRYATDDFPRQVLLREQKFTTIYKNGVAGPHPMRMSAIRNCINVTLLKKPILFENRIVQCIFIINLQPGQLFLHKEISKLLLTLMENDEVRNRIMASTSFEQFIREIENLL